MSDLERIGQDEWLLRLRISAPDREQAIQELRNYLLRGLKRSLSHRYGGKIQIEDVVQVALLKILNSLDSFQCRSRFTTWAMSIATRIGISELRRHHYRDVSLDLSLGANKIKLDVADTSSDSAENHENRRSLVAQLQGFIDEALSEKQRTAIRGTLEGLPVEEIAARLQSNRNAVYKLVHDARLRLRQRFEAAGVTAEDIIASIA